MKFRKLFSDTTRRTAFGLLLAGILAVASVAQTVEPSSQGKHYGEPGFRGEPINLNVVNADIRDILSYITDQYGINFVIDKSVKEVPVTVKVNDVPWNVALDSVLQSQDLGIQVNGNILRVADNKILAAEGEVFRARQSSQLDTTALVTEIIRLNYARAKDGLVRGSPSAGTTTTTSGQYAGTPYTEPTTTAPNQPAPSTAGNSEGILPIIQRRLSRRGSIEVDGRSNSLIITDVPANIAAVKQLIAILDQPEPQVEIEARIVVASRNFSRDIGVQLFAMLNGANGSGIQGGTLPPNIGTGTGTTKLLNGLPASQGLPLNTANGNLLSGLPSTVIGLTTGIFGTATLSSLISLGEQKGQAKVIATPRVTAVNNNKAEIKSTTKIPVTTVQPGTTGSAVIASTVYVDVPLKLEITPQITTDGNVILSVLAENSSTSTIVGGAPPAINSQSMNTQVIVPDGGTTVVGGVLFDDERDSQDRTPGIGGVPILGNLFKRKGVTRNTNEILFFITPRITRSEATQIQHGPITQPVPMGNPASNSVPLTPVGPATVVQVPGPVQAAPSPSPKTNN